MRMKIPALLMMLTAVPAALFAQQKEPPDRLKALMESYRYAEAIRLSDQLLEKDSMRSDLMLLKARALAANARVREAIALLEQAAGYDPDNLLLLGELTEDYRQAGETEHSVETCLKMIRLAPENPYFRLQLANLLMIREAFDLALPVYLELFRADTTDFYSIKQIAACYQEMEMPDSAIFFCLKGISLNPGDAGVVGRLANLYLKTEEVNAAFILTTLYLAADSVNRPILKQNAYCCYLLKEYPAAIERFRRSVALGDRSKFTWKYLGLSFYKQDLYDSAAPFFRQAYLADSTDAEIAFYYGVSAYRSGLLREGIALLNRTVGLLMPTDQFLYTLLTEQAAAYTNYGEADTALTLLLRAKELLPANNKLNFKIAYQYDYYLRDPRTALDYYKAFLAAEKENGEGSRDVPLHMSYKEYAGNRVAEISRAKMAPAVRKKK